MDLRPEMPVDLILDEKTAGWRCVMTRCTDFWKKWRKEPNFCGLSQNTVDEIEDYLSTVDKICTLGIKEDTVFENFPEGAARPLLRMDEGDPRTNVLNFVIKNLKQGEKLTSKIIQTTIKSFLPDEVVGQGSRKIPQMRKPKAPLPVEKKEPVQLHPGLKPTSPSQPAAGSILVTDLPLHPSLAEQMKEKFKPDIIPAPKLAPCNIAYGQPCPDEGNHIDKSNKIKGPCCDIIGVPLNQLPGNECPLERQERLKGTKPEVFTTAAKIIKPAPLRVVPVQLSKQEAEDRIASVVRGYFTPKDQEVVEKLLGTGELGDTYLGLFQALIWEADERMGV
jgi:hypothetical protein